MKKVVPLTDAAIRRVKPSSKDKPFFDGGGLYLLIQKNGSKLWRMKYKFMGKAGLLSLGAYPEVSISLARSERERIRREIAEGINPSIRRKAEKLSGKDGGEISFKALAFEWFERMTANMVPGHRKRILDRLTSDVFPYMGSLEASRILPHQVLSTVRRIEERGAVETARRALGNISSVFRYGVATARVPSDPCRDLRGALPPPREKHFAAILDPVRFGDLLRAIDGYRGGPVVRAGLKLAPLVIVRPGELRKAEWKDIDFEDREWRLTISKTATTGVSQLIVPLARQSIAILEDLRLLTGQGRFVFPNPRTPDGSRPLSENAFLAAIRNMGFGQEEVTVHGFRATAKTMLMERLKYRAELTELQIAHAVKDPLGRAYNRTQFLEERKAMMQTWADFLDSLRAEGAA